MSNARNLLVTGATGNVGREVVAALRARGMEARITHRPNATVSDPSSVPLDLTDPDTYDRAIEGCKAVFLLRPPAIANTRQTLNLFVDRARAADVGQIVFLSVAVAGDKRIVPHHAVEQRLRKDETGWTILRPGFFAQNLATAYRQDIVEGDRIYLPAGSGRAAFVDLRDVGELAADALLNPQYHERQTYTLTGPRAFDFGEVAAILSELVGREIGYEPASILGYLRHLRVREFAWGQVIVQTILHVGLRRGQAERVDDTLEELLGHAPRDVRDYIRDHVELWAREPRPARSP